MFPYKKDHKYISTSPDENMQYVFVDKDDNKI